MRILSLFCLLFVLFTTSATYALDHLMYCTVVGSYSIHKKDHVVRSYEEPVAYSKSDDSSTLLVPIPGSSTFPTNRGESTQVILKIEENIDGYKIDSQLLEKSSNSYVPLLNGELTGSQYFLSGKFGVNKIVKQESPSSFISLDAASVKCAVGPGVLLVKYAKANQATLYRELLTSYPKNPVDPGYLTSRLGDDRLATMEAYSADFVDIVRITVELGYREVFFRDAGGSGQTNPIARLAVEKSSPKSLAYLISVFPEALNSSPLHPEYGPNPLHSAVDSFNYENANLLLSLGANPNLSEPFRPRNWDGPVPEDLTPLCVLSMRDYSKDLSIPVSLLKLLLEKNANPNQGCRGIGSYPLNFFFEMGPFRKGVPIEILKLFVNHATNINRLDMSGRSMLFYASGANNSYISIDPNQFIPGLDYLLKAGANPNLGWPLISIAHYYSYFPIVDDAVRMLLKSGADPKLKNDKNETACSIANVKLRAIFDGYGACVGQ